MDAAVTEGFLHSLGSGECDGAVAKQALSLWLARKVKVNNGTELLGHLRNDSESMGGRDEVLAILGPDEHSTRGSDC